MVYNTLWDKLCPDVTGIYKVTDISELPASRYDIENREPGELFYKPKLLSYGDYDSSTEIERSNVRVFQRKMKNVAGWRETTYAGHSKSIMIDITTDNQKLIELVMELMEYPALDDTDCMAMKVELEMQAWSDFMKDEFVRAVTKKFNADYSDPSDADALTLYLLLKARSNTDVVVLKGGNVFIDYALLVGYIDEAPASFNMEWCSTIRLPIAAHSISLLKKNYLPEKQLHEFR